MKKLAIAIIVAALGWSAYWVVQARLTRSALDTALSDLREAGWEASYGALDVRGFPNRIDVDISELSLADPASGFAWDVPFLQVFRLVYNHSHFIFAFPDRQEIATSTGTWVVESEGLRSSLVLGDAQSLGRLHAEAESVTATGEESRIDLSALRANFDAVEAGLPVYRLSVSARDGREAGREIALRGEVTFDQPPTLAGAPARIEAVEIARMDYVLPEASVALSGDLDVDELGRLSGDVDVEAQDWQVLLEDAVAEGRVPEEWATTARGALGLVASMRGSADTLDVTLRLEDGRIFLGPIPVGTAPRLP
ncbi:hypothetical protein OCH239_21165 [Roseivivax halodurans JCM 10272]|uniref:DUF2125 domain-containing protein n=1 Tax=Roseivivax halodurans JCM 10272 TaxID=1449350 RepID=X7EIF4_9RHOB|nr:DUF2125 domain-containing protein [Roseivivax halodurans]ETX14898.1 hypothetical protein OCH239_21165 [Roseivivax halodurans JCM 10272]